MQNRAWIELLQRIPPDLHDILNVTTTSGLAISLERVIRVEEDYVVVRGRPAGTTDAGRIFFVPYDQVCFVGFIKEVKLSQVQALYGETAVDEELKQEVVEEPPAPALEAETPTPEPEPAPVPPPPPPPVPAVEPGKSRVRMPLPSKEIILERIRQRQQQNGR